MKRSLASIAVILFIAAGGSQAAEYNWKMTTIVPETSAFYKLFAPTFAKRVSELTDGRVKITPYPAGVIAPSFRAVDAVLDGTAEAAQAPPIYLVNRDPTNTFFAPLPGGMGPDALMHWVYAGGGKELLAQHRRETMGLHSMPCAFGGTEIFAHAHKPIRKAADLKGMKFRTAGAYATILKDYFGAAPVVVPGNEVYSMMERKAIDATEWSGPYENKITGLQETAKYIMYPGPQTNAWFMECAVKVKTWDALPEDLKTKIEAAAKLNAMETLLQFDTLDIEAWKSLKAGKNEIVRVDDSLVVAIREAAREWSGKIADEKAAKGEPWMKRVRESYFKFYDNWLSNAEFMAQDIKK